MTMTIQTTTCENATTNFFQTGFERFLNFLNSGIDLRMFFFLQFEIKNEWFYDRVDGDRTGLG